MRLTDKEQEVVLFLAERAEKSLRDSLSLQDLAKQFEMNDGEMEATAFLLEKHGYITLYRGGSLLPCTDIIQLGREIVAQRAEANRPPDRVEQVQAWARQNRVVAWFIVVLLVIGFLVAVAGGVLNIIAFFSGKKP